MARNTGLLLLLLSFGCTAPDDDLPAPVVDAYTPDALRFERLARIDNPGNGVVAASHGGAWVARDGVLDRIDASDASVVDTVWVDGESQSGLVLLDGDAAGFLVALGPDEVAIIDRDGAVVDVFDVPEVVRSGGLTPDGAWVVYGDGAGCTGLMLSEGQLQALGTVGCDSDRDSNRPVATGESHVALATDGEVRFALEPGSDELVRLVGPDGATTDDAVFGLDRPAIDVAAQEGQVLVLSEDGVLTHLDPETGEVLAEWHVHRPVSIESIALTRAADTIVLASEDVVVFFALDPTAPGYPLVPGGGSPGQTPGGGGSGAGPTGGGSGGASAGSAAAAGSP